MLTQTLRAEQRLSHPIEHVFDFFSRAENLGTITPPALGFEILTPAPISMSTGTIIDYRIRLHGVPMKWRTLITAWEPPFHFADVQVRGPYALWEHHHRFRPDGPGATIMEDEVTYRLPLGPLGLVALPFVRGQVRGIFEFRRTAVERLLRDWRPGS
jgi:ligand-binding SRPBCC domain-containing protein